MLLRAPAGCTGLSYAGRCYHVGSDGRIEVEDHLVALFLGQGFTPCAEARPQRPQTAPPGGMPDIDRLSRKELFAYLRRRGVRVRLPITNVALREAARRARGETAS